MGKMAKVDGIFLGGGRAFVLSINNWTLGPKQIKMDIGTIRTDSQKC